MKPQISHTTAELLHPSAAPQLGIKNSVSGSMCVCVCVCSGVFGPKPALLLLEEEGDLSVWCSDGGRFSVRCRKYREMIMRRRFKASSRRGAAVDSFSKTWGNDENATAAPGGGRRSSAFTSKQIKRSCRCVWYLWLSCWSESYTWPIRGGAESVRDPWGCLKR